MAVEEEDNLEEGSRGAPSRFHPMAKKKMILKKNISTPGFLTCRRFFVTWLLYKKWKWMLLKDMSSSLPHMVVEEEDEEVKEDDVEGDALLSLPHIAVEEEDEEEEVDDIEEEGFLLLPHMETPATFSVTSERRRCLP